MNLSDLQKELRLMEKRLSALQSEIEGMQLQPEKKDKKDYETITRLGKLYPIKKTGLKSAPKRTKELMISALSHIHQIEKEGQYSRTLYLSRLARGIGLKLSAEEIYRKGLIFAENDLDRLRYEITDYKYSFLIEMFIIVNITGNTSHKLYGMAAEVAELLKCDKDEIRVVAQVAKSVLTDNPDLLKELPLLSKNCWSGKFTEYIPREWIIKQRIKCAELYDPIDDRKSLGWKEAGTKDDMDGVTAQLGNVMNALIRTMDIISKKHSCKIIYTIKSGKIVQSGECICRYDEIFRDEVTRESNTISKTVIAPCNGIVHFVTEERENASTGRQEVYIKIYVVSYFDAFDKISV